LLEWDGRRVSDADIGFIADWIDDNCPTDDHLTSVALEPAAEPVLLERRLIREVVEFDIMAGPTPRRGYRQGELRQRPNLDCMSDMERDQRRAAFFLASFKPTMPEASDHNLCKPAAAKSQSAA
jgi:tyrosinase